MHQSRPALGCGTYLEGVRRATRGDAVRDPARIDRILELLREYWEHYPDLRLGQIVVGAIRPSQPCPQIFSAEDDVVEKSLAANVAPLRPTIVSATSQGSP